MEISIENLNIKIAKDKLETLSDLILSTDPQQNQEAINMICDLIFKNDYFAKYKIQACQHHGKTVYSIIKESLKQNKQTKSLFSMNHNVEQDLRNLIIRKQLEIDPEKFRRGVQMDLEMMNRLIDNRIEHILSIYQNQDMIYKNKLINMILITTL